MPSYPTDCGFPVPQVKGFQLAPKRSVSSIKTDMRVSRSRNLVTVDVFVFNITLSFDTKAHYDQFKEWLKYETNYGNLWFNADWFSGYGFTPGQWVFRFTTPLAVVLDGSSDEYQATVLGGPKFSNDVVPGVYKELGIGGQFIDQDYPFGYEKFECDKLTYQNTSRFNTSNGEIETYMFNGSNFTKIGNGLLLNLVGTIPRTIAAMKSDTIALTNNNLINTLRMYKFDGLNYNQLGSGTTLPGYSALKTQIKRMSDSRIAYYDGALKTLTVWDFDYVLETWSQVGVSFDLSTYILGVTNGVNNSMTYMGDGKLAFAYSKAAGAASQGQWLLTLEFDGNAWTQFGSEYEIYSAGLGGSSATFFITAISKDKIVLTHNDDPDLHTYERRLTTFTLLAGVWSPGVSSAQYAAGGDNAIAAITSDRVVLERFISPDLGIIIYDYNGSTWEEVPNGLSINNISSVGRLTAYFQPE